MSSKNNCQENHIRHWWDHSQTDSYKYRRKSLLHIQNKVKFRWIRVQFFFVQKIQNKKLNKVKTAIMKTEVKPIPAK